MLPNSVPEITQEPGGVKGLLAQITQEDVLSKFDRRKLNRYLSQGLRIHHHGMVETHNSSKQTHETNKFGRKFLKQKGTSLCALYSLY